MIIYIIMGSIIILAAIGMVIIYYYNKFQYIIIKIDEAENVISNLLEKRIDLFKRFLPVLNKHLKKDNQTIKNIEDLTKDIPNKFELNKDLATLTQCLNEEFDNNSKLRDDKDISEQKKELFDNGIELKAAEKFYNDNIVLYNKLIKCFPSNIISKLFKYKSKDFYSNEKEEIYKILQNKDDNGM